MRFLNPPATCIPLATRFGSPPAMAGPKLHGRGPAWLDVEADGAADAEFDPEPDTPGSRGVYGPVARTRGPRRFRGVVGHIG